jgi:predicted dehydrogenase
MKLCILDPGHFHAALLQKNMYPDVDAEVHVYAPEGPDLRDYLAKIDGFNSRSDSPTRWVTRLHTGADFFERCLRDKAGDLVVICGNNRRKTEYIGKLIAAGIHVLADKPMVIDASGFADLEKIFAVAAQKGVMLYDVMTERHEITTMLQKEFSGMPAVFGTLLAGDAARPAVTKESVHHFSKIVAGAPLKRPGWCFDIAQQGEGIIDVTTHLVDLVQWECFPGVSLDYRSDIDMLSARRWPTAITPAQFEKVTGLASWPDYLQKDVQADGALHVYANGEFSYRLRGVHAKVSVLWNFEAPPGSADTHFSVMRGSLADLAIRQGPEQHYQPALYIEPAKGADRKAFAMALEQSMKLIEAKYPGLGLRIADAGWEVTVPAAYHIGHEAHFGQVATQFLSYLEAGAMPEWEVPNMLAKYFTTTLALERARAG